MMHVLRGTSCSCDASLSEGMIEIEFGTSFDLRDRQACHLLLKIFETDRVLDVGGITLSSMQT